MVARIIQRHESSLGARMSFAAIFKTFGLVFGFNEGGHIRSIGYGRRIQLRISTDNASLMAALLATFFIAIKINTIKTSTQIKEHKLKIELPHTLAPRLVQSPAAHA
jgi:hypothetical protein